MPATAAPAGAITPPLKGSAYRRAAAGDWAPTGEGYWVKPLYADAATGERTLLMRIDPGTVSHPHSHEGEFEQIYILEGSFEDDNGRLGPGDYACRAPGSVHSGRTETGCVMLLIYSRREP
jgi:anti-sigma factor ChrR (cupin superfamily)